MLHHDLKKYQNIDRLIDQFISKLIAEEDLDPNDPADKIILKKLIDAQLEARDLVIHIDDAINANR